jgi:POLQ-like helicase
MTTSSRRNAQTWPYPRHREFENQLRESNAQWFAEHRFEVNPRMPYLLSEWDNWPNNIILPEVAAYIETERQARSKEGRGFPLHKYIHHGLSSQAMLFNLIGPVIIQNNLSLLEEAFIRAGIPWPAGENKLEYEVEDRSIFSEDTGQPTSIDLLIQGTGNSWPLFIEAKLVEREFGGCSVFDDGDCDGRNPAGEFGICYLHHLGRKYWSLMEHHGFLDGPAGKSPICPLAMYYQFFREVIFALESGGEFVLLFDERNPAFYSGAPGDHRGLMPFLSTFVPPAVVPRLHSISIQKVVKVFREKHQANWLDEFEKKYALIK